MGAFALSSTLAFAKSDVVENKNVDTKATISFTSKIVKVDALSICTITITETNSIGMVVNQWQEQYYVADWDFAGCRAIGENRIRQLNAGL